MKNKENKHQGIFLLLLVLLSAFLLTALGLSAGAAVKMPIVDGYPRNSEWEGSRKTTLFKSAVNSGNSLHFAYFHFIPDFENNRFAFAFKAAGPDCLLGSRAGISLKADKFGTLWFDLTDAENPTYDGELTHVRSAMMSWHEYGSDEFSGEAIVDLKRSFPATFVLTIQIFDSRGEPSLPFSFTVENEYALMSSTAPPLLTDAYYSTTKKSKTRPSNTVKQTKPNTSVKTVTTKSDNVPSAAPSVPAYTVVPSGTLPAVTAPSVGNKRPQSVPTARAEDESAGIEVLNPRPVQSPPVDNTDGITDFWRGGTLRTLAFAGAFALLIAAAAIGVLRKPRGEMADEDDMIDDVY